MTERFKSIARSLAFFLVLALLLSLASTAFSKLPPNRIDGSRFESNMHLEASGVYAEPENTVDLLIVGDSEAFSSFSPLNMWREYGITSHVCGSPLQPLSDTLGYIKRALEHQSPSLVILEVDNFFEPTVKLDSLMVPVLEDPFPLFQYHDRWKSLLGGAAQPPYNKTDPNKGYLLTFKTLPHSPVQYMDEVAGTEPVPGMNKTAISMILRLCSSRDIPVLLVSAPHFTWTTEKSNGVSLLAEKQGLPFVDLNLTEDLDIDWEQDTSDGGDHLNLKGTSKVSTYLGRLLRDEYGLADHRGDPAYASWDEALADFEYRVENEILGKDHSRA